MNGAASVSYDGMPKQGAFAGRRTRVCFNYDTSRIVMGTIVRYDIEAPFLTIIRLDDGRYILGTECQFSPEPA